MKKIIFHHNCLERGGAERVISTLSNQLSQEGYEVIVATEWQSKEEFELNKEVRRVHVGLSESEESKGRITKAIIRLKNLRRLLKNEKADIAIGFTRKPIYRLLMAALGVKIPVIIAVRMNPVGGYDTALDKLLLPFLMKRADGAVFQTNDQRDFFLKYLKNESIIILNPLNEKYVDVPVPEEKENVIVHSGRIVDCKNQVMLINAFLEVHRKHPEYSLKIYGPDSGDGTLENLEQLIAQKDAQGCVFMMGSSDSLEKELPKGKIFAMSSDYEGMPNALLEAMCLGMPVISTDCPCGGPRAVIENETNGILVPVGDEKAMANAIARLIEDPQMAEQMGAEARRLADKISVTAITNQWCEYINKVIEKR